MKFNKLITLAASLTIALTGALFVSQQDASAEVTKVTSTGNSTSKLYTKDGDLITNRALAPKTNWLVDRIFTHNDVTYYQVATNEYLKSTSTTRLYDKSNPNFKYVPNVKRINEYFIKYLNVLHAANGTPAVSTSEEMFEYANHRAYQQVGDTMDHSTRPRNTAENLYGFGFNFILKNGIYKGMTSDRDVAWYLIKGWYDDNNNASAGPGEIGHFGHRAELIYTGTPAAIGMSDNSTSLSSEWTNDFDGYNSIYEYTGTNPNTNFISKDSVK
ncbi:hypothetical protein EGT49_01990 [Companilactobacillus suantsaicola]|uniref:SCP domain-containing protein n=1 Tax=Companilactobacillus suantsaicola TaxID=2487723 RepID=A0A4Z0JRU0_9LACO|nr:hypothetical protein [Companilactobacillus suantsaicola]TGD24906.1 hypothetical protein EGT49_01990 [Companilactobacillus suantsaicola]